MFARPRHVLISQCRRIICRGCKVVGFAPVVVRIISTRFLIPHAATRPVHTTRTMGLLPISIILGRKLAQTRNILDIQPYKMAHCRSCRTRHLLAHRLVGVHVRQQMKNWDWAGLFPLFHKMTRKLDCI